jgi:hypothetical protein
MPMGGVGPLTLGTCRFFTRTLGVNHPPDTNFKYLETDIGGSELFFNFVEKVVIHAQPNRLKNRETFYFLMKIHQNFIHKILRERF